MRKTTKQQRENYMVDCLGYSEEEAREGSNSLSESQLEECFEFSN